jgi:hypothetical protein
MIEFADLLEGLPQLVIIAQPAAHLVYLSATEAELPVTAARVADGENPKRVPSTIGADRAAAGMAHRPLDQRAPQFPSGVP